MQLGIEYGHANTTGLPDDNAVKKLIHAAVLQHGIKILDTGLWIQVLDTGLYIMILDTGLWIKVSDAGL